MKKILALVLALMLLGTAALAAKTVAPDTAPIDPANVPDGMYPATFEAEKITVNEDGTATVEVTFAAEEAYDIVDVDQLEVGDTIVSDGEEIVVEKIEHIGNCVFINEGYIEGGVTLANYPDMNGWIAVTYDSVPLYANIGTATMTISKDVVYHDTAEVEMGLNDKEINVTGVEAMLEGMHFHESDNTDFKPFVQTETTVTVENGVITEINHRYVQ